MEQLRAPPLPRLRFLSCCQRPVARRSRDGAAGARASAVCPAGDACVPTACRLRTRVSGRPCRRWRFSGGGGFQRRFRYRGAGSWRGRPAEGGSAFAGRGLPENKCAQGACFWERCRGVVCAARVTCAMAARVRLSHVTATCPCGRRGRPAVRRDGSRRGRRQPRVLPVETCAAASRCFCRRCSPRPGPCPLRVSRG